MIQRHFGGLDLIFYSARSFAPPVLPYFSGCLKWWSSALGEEAHHPFQVLSGSRQQELLGDIPRAPQSHAAQAHLLFQFGEQSSRAVHQRAPGNYRSQGRQREQGPLLTLREPTYRRNPAVL